MARILKDQLPAIDILKDIKIGERIVKIRKEKGLTQKELAAKLGIKRTLMADYEIGRIRIYSEMVARIALVLNVTSDEILGLKPLKNIAPFSLKIVRRLKKISELSPKLQKDALHNIDLLISALEKHKRAS
jgi:transcriptional regulator with XRE-family HTH domain